jgi:hypothetical protein
VGFYYEATLNFMLSIIHPVEYYLNNQEAQGKNKRNFILIPIKIQNKTDGDNE